MIPKKARKNVLVSFRIVNTASIGTLAGTLRYIRTLANWNIRLFTSQSELLPETVDSAPQDGIDGIFIHHPLHETLADALLRSRIPLVSIGNSDERLFTRRRNVAFLEMDGRKIGEEGARYLRSLGHFRSFGFLPDIPQSRWSMTRSRGFSVELRRQDMPVSVFHSNAPHASDRYRSDLSKWLAGLSRPAAVMMAGDYHALNVFDVCTKAHLSIPGDIAILGVDNDPAFCDATVPALSSIELPFEKEGFEAARLLDKLMRSRQESTRQIIVRFAPNRIVERESTAFVSSGTHLIDRAIKFINDNCCSTISAHDVSTRLGVSPALLARLFRLHERTTVRETIIAARMKAVRSLLKTTKLPIGHIAARCGFSTANRLSHFFTARQGMSPRAYRESSSPSNVTST